MCRIAGRYVLQLMKKGILPSDIMTRQAFENAMVSVIATGAAQCFPQSLNVLFQSQHWVSCMMKGTCA